MEITDNLKESLNFPIQNYEKWLIVGVLFLIIGIFSFLNTSYPSSVMSTINTIVDIVLGLILFGYSISIIKATINGENLPQFDIVKNIVDGVKVAVLDFVYLIIPTIITILVAWGTGVFSNFIKVVNIFANNATASSASIPASLSTSLTYGVIITVIIAVILYLIFILLAYIGMARMAEFDSLKEGLSFVEVFHKISSIGWMKYVGWFILFVIILMVLSLISGLIDMIPYVGTFINALIVSSFIMLFTYRSLGNIYNE